ncbi:MAG: hypothetical protein ACTHQ3_07150 [Motilibacteraceae bacterium]
MSARARGGAVRRAAWVAAAATVVPLAACAAPSYRVSSNTGTGMAFRVPWSWQQYTAADLERAVARANKQVAGSLPEVTVDYQVAYAARRGTDAADVLTPEATDHPVVLVRVYPLSAADAAAMTPDTARDAFVPVTDALTADLTAASGTATTTPATTTTTSATALAGRSSGPAFAGGPVLHQTSLPGLVLGVVKDTDLSGGSRVGARDVMVVQLGGEKPMVIDQTVVVDQKKDKAYTLRVRCSVACWQEQRSVIDDVATSLRIRD